jgi:hypothetical protein
MMIGGPVEVTDDLVVMINLSRSRRLATSHLAAPFAFNSSSRHLSDENLIQDAHQVIAVHHQILVPIYLPVGLKCSGFDGSRARRSSSFDLQVTTNS